MRPITPLLSDARGLPLLIFHGSRSGPLHDVRELRVAPHDETGLRGIAFTRHRAIAERYAHDESRHRPDEGLMRPHVFAAHVHTQRLPTRDQLFREVERHYDRDILRISLPEVEAYARSQGIAAVDTSDVGEPGEIFVLDPSQIERAQLGRALFGDRRAPDGSLVAENFDAWFDGSQVVDPATGAPLVVYHGTRADFTTFKPGPDGGIHFGTIDAASWRLADIAGDDCASGNFYLPVYLSIRNPKIVFDAGHWRDWAEEIALAKLEGHDGLVYENFGEADEDDDLNKITTTSFVAFEPGQVKSALGNSGLFDRHSHDLVDAHAWASRRQQSRERMRA